MNTIDEIYVVLKKSTDDLLGIGVMAPCGNGVCVPPKNPLPSCTGVLIPLGIGVCIPLGRGVCVPPVIPEGVGVAIPAT